MIWSSTRSGLLPGHSVKMITWVSERSGIASSGAPRSEYQPHTAIAATKSTVKNGLRAEVAMIQAIGPRVLASLLVIDPSPVLKRRSNAALRGDKEISRRHHDVTLANPFDHLVIVASLCTEFDFLGAQATLA